MNPRALLLPVLAVLCALAGGCTSAQLTRVQPWERAELASYPMRPDRDPLASAMSEHIYFSREATSGGRGVGGAGCGCN
jgi:hypothetical protein